MYNIFCEPVQGGICLLDGKKAKSEWEMLIISMYLRIQRSCAG